MSIQGQPTPTGFRERDTHKVARYIGVSGERRLTAVRRTIFSEPNEFIVHGQILNQLARRDLYALYTHGC